MAKALAPQTVALLDTLNEVAQHRHAGSENIVHTTRYSAMPGAARDRVYQETDTHQKDEAPNFDRAQRMVQCFVDRKDGTVLYAAGWTTPAKWKDGPATEFNGSEYRAYAEFVAAGGWGYKGQRKAWEDSKA